MDWYKNHFKLFSIVAITLLTLTAGALYYGQSNYQKIGKTQLAKDGVGTCFQRVTQTFTALMIGQIKSNYLTSSFINSTGDCFTEVNKIFTHEMSQFKGANEVINKLISDSHWFHEKALKIALVNKGNGDLTSSNIVDKFSQLEQTRDTLVNFLSDRNESLKLVAETGSNTALIFFFMLVTVSIVYLFVRLSTVKKLELLEKAAAELSESNQYFEIETVISKALKLSGLDTIRQLFLDTRTNLFTPVKTNIVPPEEALVMNPIVETESARAPAISIVQSISLALKNIKDKAFTHGVIIDLDVDDNLNVMAPIEGFEQLMFNALDYATDASITQNEGRKVSVRTKGLGGTAYVKFLIANHCFNTTELEYFSGGKVDSNSIGLNLTLIQELVADMGATIQVRNKAGKDGGVQNAEIEFAFDVNEVVSAQTIGPVKDNWENEVVSADEVRKENTTEIDNTVESTKLISIIKGKKRDLLRRMNSEV